MARIGTRQSLTEYLDKRFEFWLEESKKEANYEDEEENIERRFIHEWFNELETYRNAFIVKYRNQIKQKGQHYPRKWMENDERISTILKKYPRISVILNTIEEWKDGDYLYLLRPKGKRFNEEYPHGWIYGEKKHPLAVFIADSRFYDAIVPRLEIVESTLHKYLQAFHKTGILKKLPNTGKYKNLPIYAVGYFSEYKEDKFKLNRFLTSGKKEALREFTLHETGISKKLPYIDKKQKDIELVYSEEDHLSQVRDIEEAAKFRRRRRQ